jgi:hypothetical protein
MSPFAGHRKYKLDTHNVKTVFPLDSKVILTTFLVKARKRERD